MGLVLGSKTSLVHNVPCPVLVVRKPSILVAAHTVFILKLRWNPDITSFLTYRSLQYGLVFLQCNGLRLFHSHPRLFGTYSTCVREHEHGCHPSNTWCVRRGYSESIEKENTIVHPKFYHTLHLPQLVNQLPAPPSSTPSGALLLITTSSPNSSTIASAPPAPAAPTKSASHFTRNTPSCAIPPLPLLLLNQLTRFPARLLLSRRLRQIQSPPPHFSPHGQPFRAKSRSRLHRQRCRLRHQRRPVIRCRPAWQRGRPSGRESQHCGIGVRERAAERGVGGGLVQSARSEYSVHLCMNPSILFPWGTMGEENC